MIQHKRDNLHVFKDLNDFEWNRFITTYQCHMRALGISKRDKYGLDQIKRIERNIEESCFEVYYKNGDWWHYTLDGNWY